MCDDCRQLSGGVSEHTEVRQQSKGHKEQAQDQQREGWGYVRDAGMGGQRISSVSDVVLSVM